MVKYNDTRGVDSFGYPIAAILDGEYVCPNCIEHVEDGDYRDSCVIQHLEGDSLFCRDCSVELTSAYGE